MRCFNLLLRAFLGPKIKEVLDLKKLETKKNEERYNLMKLQDGHFPSVLKKGRIKLVV
jgi:hypothetical protein